MSSRISELELALRRTRAVGICALLLTTGAALTAFTRGHDEVVRAERVELVDAKGLRHALLVADSAGFVVTVLDKRDRPAGSFRLTGEPRVTVEESDGQEVAGLGAPKVHNLTE